MGRDLPLGQLLTAWKSAVTARERRLVLVAGEPGIGKTRLAAAVAAEVAVDGARVLHGWCDDGVGIAYEAWVHALGGFVQGADDDEIAALAPLAPDLVRCISVVGERVPDVVPRPTTDAASDRARLFDAVDALLAQITGTSPLLLVLDDLHWADPATLGLLRWILSSERGGPMLVLGIYRDTDVDRRHRWASCSPTSDATPASSGWLCAVSRSRRSARCSCPRRARRTTRVRHRIARRDRRQPVLRRGGRDSPGGDRRDLPA